MGTIDDKRRALRRPLPIRLLEGFGIVLLLLTLGATLAGMLGRYLHLRNVEGSFEIAGLAFVWLTFIGTVIAEVRRENVRFEGLILLLPPVGRYVLEWVNLLVLLGVGLWLANSGWSVLQQSGHVPTPVLRWPAGILSSALFSTALMLVALAVWRLAGLLKSSSKDSP
ncbi:TRAP transporter small permease [Castellaniella hirudinis]|uniref:TRAP transporter small permease protein n=1 Tax=Castellaniella hirudinis TaxID=1144617 RepID=A0ABV8S295_9BURK